MSGRLARKIPMKFIYNSNRYYKTRDDQNTILLQACFDNPIFQEESNKYQNDENNVSNDKFHRIDYSYAGGPGRPTEVHFRKTNLRQKYVRILATIVIAVLLIALIIALLVVFVGKTDQNEPEVLFKTNRMSGRLRIIRGPYSVYTSSLHESSSEMHQFFSRSLIYKMNAIFHSSSDYKNVYNSTIINSYSSGSVIVYFTITFKSPVDIYSSTADSIKSLIITEFQDSVFLIDENAVKITPVAPPVLPSTVSPGLCQPISFQQCINKTDYKFTSFPNIAGHKNQDDLAKHMNEFESFFNEPCYPYSATFFCSYLSPECRNGRRIPPCRQFCKDVRDSCVNRTFPINCDTLPDSSDPSICVSNPYTPGKCFEYKNVTFERCWNMGYKETAFPNYAGSISEMQAAPLVNLVTSIQDATQCYRHASLFACSAFVPKCTGRDVVGQHTIPPCRSLCEATKAGCEVFMDIFSMPWPKELNCSSLVDVNDTSVCIGYAEAHEPRKIDDCPVGNLRCDTDVCIPPGWVCDGYQDCADKADEQHCAQCPAGQERCEPASGKCISSSSICDGISDCYEDVDEAQCVGLGEDGTNSGTLMVKDGVSTHWQEVCTDNWNSNFSSITCLQLGYKDVKTYAEVTAGTNLKSAISVLRNGTSDMIIQSYLQKSLGSCASGKVVQLTCEKPVCGTRPAHYPSQLKIVNGDSVDPGTWPTQVSLHGGVNEAYYCGASLLGHNWVMTAGHCVGGKTTGDGITLKIGAARRHTYNPYRQVRKAKNVYVHPSYSPITVDNDIALIELDAPVYFNDFLRPICLPEPKKETPVETRCYAVGWGRRSEKAMGYERALKQVTLSVVNWDTCNDAIKNSPVKSSYKLTKNMICAGGSLDHDACQGDSGGPLLCPRNMTLDTWYIGGVVSWGIGCAIPNVPGVYTEVPLYVEWVRNVTKGEIQ